MLIILPLAFAAFVLLGGIAYQSLGTALDSRRYPPPGRLVEVDGRRLHIHRQGQGGPVVVLEAGIAASSVSWQRIQPELARFTTVCSYDRAGLGWSEAAHDPPSFEALSRDLRALLAKAEISMPVVLVGHSFGGLLALDFACRRPADVAGLVLVDPLSAAEWCPVTPKNAVMLRRGISLARRGAWVARLGLVRCSLDLLQAGSRRIPKLAARLSSGSGSEITERLVGEVRKLPRDLWPVIQYHWCQPKCFHAMAEHLESLPANAAACLPCDLGSMPLIILSASNCSAERRAQHQAMAQRSSRGKMVVAEKSGHWIQLDEPELVIEAVREVLTS